MSQVLLLFTLGERWNNRRGDLLRSYLGHSWNSIFKVFNFQISFCPIIAYKLPSHTLCHETQWISCLKRLRELWSISSISLKWVYKSQSLLDKGIRFSLGSFIPWGSVTITWVNDFVQSAPTGFVFMHFEFFFCICADDKPLWLGSDY